MPIAFRRPQSELTAALSHFAIGIASIPAPRFRRLAVTCQTVTQRCKIAVISPKHKNHEAKHRQDTPPTFHDRNTFSDNPDNEIAPQRDTLSQNELE